MIAEALFGRSATARSYDPVHPRDPVLAKIFGTGQKTAAGISVTEDRVLAIPTILRGATILSHAVMKLERDVYKVTPSGLEPDEGHFARPFITLDFNEEMLASDAIEVMTTWMILRGNAVAWINRDQAGRPIDIIPLLPDRTGIFRISKNGVHGNVEHAGKLMYWTQIGGVTHKILPENVVHIRGFSKNGLWGEDIIDLCKETLGGDLATREHGHRFFGGGATNAGFVTVPKGLPPEAEERLIHSLRSNLDGLGNAHKYVILEEGQVVTPNTISNNDSQFLESKEFNARDIANIIRIQASKVGDRKQQSYNSLEMAGQEHKDDDVCPILCKWQDEFDKKLLTTEQRANRTHAIRFDDSQLEWVPFKDRVTSAKDLHLNNLASKDEGRKKVGLPPVKDGSGDQFLTPLNHVPADLAEKPDVEVSPDDGKVTKINPKKGESRQESRKLSAPEAVQKVYLGVNKVITSDEARDIVNKETGAGLPVPGPEFSPQQSEPEGGSDAALVHELTKDAISRIEKRLRSVAVKKSAKESDFVAWVDDLQVDQGPDVLADVTRPIMSELKQQLNNLLDTATSGKLSQSEIETIFNNVFGGAEQ